MTVVPFVEFVRTVESRKQETCSSGTVSGVSFVNVVRTVFMRVNKIMKTNATRQKDENSPARCANPADVESIDAIITAAYDGISGPAGKQRDWDRERSLYYPGARLIPTAREVTSDEGSATADSSVGERVMREDKGKLAPQILDIEGFIARVEPFFKENGFYEKEIARRTEQFGNIAHVWSIYESRHAENDPEPFMRGINSIQLFNDGKRWWIVNIYWQQAFGSLLDEWSSIAEEIPRSAKSHPS